MHFSSILKEIDKRFQEALSAKTGWGRNEVLSAYRDVVIKTLADIVDTVVEDSSSKNNTSNYIQATTDAKNCLGCADPGEISENTMKILKNVVPDEKIKSEDEVPW